MNHGNRDGSLERMVPNAGAGRGVPFCPGGPASSGGPGRLDGNRLCSRLARFLSFAGLSVSTAHCGQRLAEKIGDLRVSAGGTSLRDLAERLLSRIFGGGRCRAVSKEPSSGSGNSPDCPSCGTAPGSNCLYEKHGVAVKRCPGCGSRFSGTWRSFTGNSPARPGQALLTCDLPTSLANALGRFLHPALSTLEILQSAATLARGHAIERPSGPDEVPTVSSSSVDSSKVVSIRMLLVSDSLILRLPFFQRALRQSKEVNFPTPGVIEFCTPGGSLPGGPWDMIVFADCLDRFPGPSAMLSAALGVLGPDGTVAAVVPDRASTQASALGRAWKFISPRRRIVAMDFKALDRALAAKGLRVADMVAESKEGAGRPGYMVLLAKPASRFEFPPFRDRGGKSPRVLFRLPRAAMGDLLLATPVFRAFRTALPSARLEVWSPGPLKALAGNPHVDETHAEIPAGPFDRVVTLAYDLTPGMSILDSYARCAGLDGFGPNPEDRRPVLPDLPEASVILRNGGLKGKLRYAVIHTLNGDRIKRWAPVKFQEVADFLVSTGHAVVTVGSPGDCVSLEGALNLIGRIDILSTMAVIGGAELFFGLDSFPMHAACAAGVRSVAIFGSTCARKVVSDGSSLVTVETDEPCGGCRMRCLPTQFARNAWCRRDTLRCMEGISAGRVVGALKSILDGTAAFMGSPGQPNQPAEDLSFSQREPFK